MLCKFQKWKVYQNQPSGTFSNFTLYILGTWEQLLKKLAIYIFFTIMEKISLFTTNMVDIYFHTQYKNMWMAGWLITKLFEGLHTEICKFKEKYFSFHLTSRQCFPHNFVNIQQIWLVGGLNCFYRTHAYYEQQETHLYFLTYIYPLLLPLPPKFQSYIESYKIAFTDLNNYAKCLIYFLFQMNCL